MKKVVFVILAVLIILPVAYAQAVPASEFKVVLIDSIKDYLVSQTPKLEKDELKDLIIVYLTAPSDTIDLSGNGKFSGKKLLDTYNKAKGTTPGKYSKEVANAVKLDKETDVYPGVSGGIAYGFYKGVGQTGYIIPQGSTIWFLVDPKQFTGISESMLKTQFTDFAQGDNLRAYTYILDRNDNPLYEPTIPMSLNSNTGWFITPWHTDEKKYLIKIIEDGTRYTPYSLYWWFEPTGQGQYAKQVTNAVKLDKLAQYDHTYYGYINKGCSSGGDYPIKAGTTTWFLIDPKGFTGISNPNIRIDFIECSQQANLYINLHALDRTNNLNSNPPFNGQNPMPGGLGQGVWGFYSYGKHREDLVYLVEVIEKSGENWGLSIAWKFY